MKNIFCILISLGINALHAQQPAQYSLYFLNPTAFNPAAAGTENSLIFTGGFRQQWSGLEGSPQTQSLTVHLPVYYLHSGAGLKIENDVLGARRMTQVQLQWSVGQKLAGGILSVGAGAGMAQMAIDFTKLRTPDGEYGSSFNHNDNTLNVPPLTAVAPIVEAGVYFKNENLNLGIGATQLTESKFRFQEIKITNWQAKRSLFAHFSTGIKLFGNVKCFPSVLVKSDLTQHQADFTLYGQYDENILLGASYRGYSVKTTDAVVFFAGFKLSPQWRLNYAYDWTLSPLRTVQTGSHEIILQYNLGEPIGKGKLPPIIYHPRF
jgi:type IX secretion system PorP/SprF family membrane protein